MAVAQKVDDGFCVLVGHAELVLHIRDPVHLVLGDDTVAQGGDDLRLEDILPARDLVGEGRGDNTCEKGDDADAHDRRDRAHQLADRRDRRDIAVTDGGQGDQRPPR